MRFYYISFFSLILLGVIYAVGTGLLVWFGSWLRKQWKRAWIVMVPLFLLLYAAPVAEEFWIAWNFGQLCRKDAGIFISKTVEVEGFYDATRPTHAESRSKQAADDLDKGGYHFYEMVYPNYKGGPNQVVHLEKVHGEWTATVLDHPTARYHYRWPNSHTPVAHKIVKHSQSVVDTEAGEELGKEVSYGRDAPWFFIGLDRPVMLCPTATEAPLMKYGAIYRLTLKPEGQTN